MGPPSCDLKIQHSRNLAILKFVDLTSGCYISLDFEVVQTEKNSDSSLIRERKEFPKRPLTLI